LESIGFTLVLGVSKISSLNRPDHVLTKTRRGASVR
jgi:hypothetical protein